MEHGPGPASRRLAERLARVESPNITSLEPYPPIFWKSAHNAHVTDADGRTYVDFTSGFGVAFAGHANPHVVAAIQQQAAHLCHAMGDVYPAEVKVALLEKLAEIAPGSLSVSILGANGADAVEAALKTAVMRTGRPGVLAFEGGYHGLGYGALATTWRQDFRRPFNRQLNLHVSFAPYPTGVADPARDPGVESDRALRTVEDRLDDAKRRGGPIGAVIIEPIQGRGGIVVPPASFLEGLRSLCDGETTVLIFDEIYTGMGRTGRWFASEYSAVVPDIMTVGKALTGSLPLSAAIGTPDVMSAWPTSEGEAIHTSTFLGNPLSCAAALGQIGAIESGGLLGRSVELGRLVRGRLERMVDLRLAVTATGVGLMQGVVLRSADMGLQVMRTALEDGLIVLPEGDGSVIAVMPPATIAIEDLDAGLSTLERAIHRAQPA